MTLPTPANDNLPAWPRGLHREQAAAYIGVGTTLFDAMVKDGRMPQPKRINARTVWDRLALDSSFEKLDCEESRNGWEFAA
jgi:predicted DNA-binding transcriptional regulator AlpA